MVHIKKCPRGKRGNPSREFVKDGKWQIYCYGWVDKRTDEPCIECQTCLDFVDGEQFLIDYEEVRQQNESHE